MSHLDEGLMHELVDGEVPSTELAPIQAHLALCAECRAKLNEARELVSGVDGLIELIELPAAAGPSRTAIPHRKPTRWVRVLAWAATVVMAAGLGYAARPIPIVEQRPLAVTPVDTPAVVATRQLEPAPKPAPVASAAAKARDQAVAPSVKPTTPPTSVGGVAAEASRTVAAALPPAAASLGRGSDSGVRLDAPRGNLTVTNAPNPLVGRRVDGGGGRGRVRPLPIDTISFTDAIGRLGGRIRLIDGLVPVRFEAQGAFVRVIYSGELILQQQVINSEVFYKLVGPSTMSDDSLARLRALIRN